MSIHPYTHGGRIFRTFCDLMMRQQKGEGDYCVASALSRLYIRLAPRHPFNIELDSRRKQVVALSTRPSNQATVVSHRFQWRMACANAGDGLRRSPAPPSPKTTRGCAAMALPFGAMCLSVCRLIRTANQYDNALQASPDGSPAPRSPGRRLSGEQGTTAATADSACHRDFVARSSMESVVPIQSPGAASASMCGVMPLPSYSAPSGAKDAIVDSETTTPL